MATLELRKSSRWWYGRWTENGRTIVRNLDVEVLGQRPSESDGHADRPFEKSRAAADAKLQELVRESRTRKHVEGLAQAVHVARTGHRIGTIPITGIFDAWMALPRRRSELSATYVSIAKGVFKRLADFLADRHPAVKEMADVTHEMAVAFLASERARGVSGRSFNAVLSLVKGAFRHLRRPAGIVDNPFDDIVSQEQRTVHRIPFTPVELRAILDAAKNDAFCRPLLVTGMCTAMRRGDVCRLRWADVDMEKRFITVNTSKTGARVTIPMFGMLHDELAQLPRTSEYCFPEQAVLYQGSPDGVARKLGRVFAAAGFVDADDDEAGGEGAGQEQRKKVPGVFGEVLSDAEMLRRGSASLQGCARYTEKVRCNLFKVFERYMAGATSGEIRKEFGLSKGGVSTYLKRIEEVVGFPVVRQRRPKPDVMVLGPMHATRQGMKKVNQRGFHALRSTWVTLALTAGVPVDLVRKVTGHTTVETVLAHYFQPGREDFRRTLEKAMPALLTNGAPTRGEQVRAILEGMTARTWRQDRERALALVE
jgi:integrase